MLRDSKQNHRVSSPIVSSSSKTYSPKIVRRSHGITPGTHVPSALYIQLESSVRQLGTVGSGPVVESLQSIERWIIRHEPLPLELLDEMMMCIELVLGSDGIEADVFSEIISLSSHLDARFSSESFLHTLGERITESILFSRNLLLVNLLKLLIIPLKSGIGSRAWRLFHALSESVLVRAPSAAAVDALGAALFQIWVSANTLPCRATETEGLSQQTCSSALKLSQVDSYVLEIFNEWTNWYLGLRNFNRYAEEIHRLFSRFRSFWKNHPSHARELILLHYNFLLNFGTDASLEICCKRADIFSFLSEVYIDSCFPLAEHSSALQLFGNLSSIHSSLMWSKRFLYYALHVHLRACSSLYPPGSKVLQFLESVRPILLHSPPREVVLDVLSIVRVGAFGSLRNNDVVGKDSSSPDELMCAIFWSSPIGLRGPILISMGPDERSHTHSFLRNCALKLPGLWVPRLAEDAAQFLRRCGVEKPSASSSHAADLMKLVAMWISNHDDPDDYQVLLDALSTDFLADRDPGWSSDQICEWISLIVLGLSPSYQHTRAILNSSKAIATFLISNPLLLTSSSSIPEALLRLAELLFACAHLEDGMPAHNQDDELLEGFALLAEKWVTQLCEPDASAESLLRLVFGRVRWIIAHGRRVRTEFTTIVQHLMRACSHVHKIWNAGRPGNSLEDVIASAPLLIRLIQLHPIMLPEPKVHENFGWISSPGKRSASTFAVDYLLWLTKSDYLAHNAVDLPALPTLLFEGDTQARQRALVDHDYAATIAVRFVVQFLIDTRFRSTPLGSGISDSLSALFQTFSRFSLHCNRQQQQQSASFKKLHSLYCHHISFFVYELERALTRSSAISFYRAYRSEIVEWSDRLRLPLSIIARSTRDWVSVLFHGSNWLKKVWVPAIKSKSDTHQKPPDEYWQFIRLILYCADAYAALQLPESLIGLSSFLNSSMVSDFVVPYNECLEDRDAQALLRVRKSALDFCAKYVSAAFMFASGSFESAGELMKKLQAHSLILDLKSNFGERGFLELDDLNLSGHLRLVSDSCRAVADADWGCYSKSLGNWVEGGNRASTEATWAALTQVASPDPLPALLTIPGRKDYLALLDDCSRPIGVCENLLLYFPLNNMTSSTRDHRPEITGTAECSFELMGRMLQLARKQNNLTAAQKIFEAGQGIHLDPRHLVGVDECSRVLYMIEAARWEFSQGRLQSAFASIQRQILSGLSIDAISSVICWTVRLMKRHPEQKSELASLSREMRSAIDQYSSVSHQSQQEPPPGGLSSIPVFELLFYGMDSSNHVAATTTHPGLWWEYACWLRYNAKASRNRMGPQSSVIAIGTNGGTDFSPTGGASSLNLDCARFCTSRDHVSPVFESLSDSGSLNILSAWARQFAQDMAAVRALDKFLQYSDMSPEPSGVRLSPTWVACQQILEGLETFGLPYLSEFDTILKRIKLEPWFAIQTQVISRLGQLHPKIAAVLNNLIARMTKLAPSATVYPLVAATKSSNEAVRQDARSILDLGFGRNGSVRVHAENFLADIHTLCNTPSFVWWKALKSAHSELREIDDMNSSSSKSPGVSSISIYPTAESVQLAYTKVRSYHAEQLRLLLTKYSVENGASYRTALEKEFSARKLRHLELVVSELSEPPVSAAEWRASLSDDLKRLSAAADRVVPAVRTFSLKQHMPQCAVREYAAPLPYSGDSIYSDLQVQSIEPLVEVLRSKTRPKKISLRASDGAVRHYLLKGMEDLRLDERMMEFLRLCNTLLASRPKARRLGLRAVAYAVTPVHEDEALIEWVENSVPMFSLINSDPVIGPIGAQSLHPATAGLSGGTGRAIGPLVRPLETFYATLEELLHQRGLPSNCSRSHWPLKFELDLYRKLIGHGVHSFLSRALWLGAGNSSGWLRRQTAYSVSLAVMSMIGHILGLGDRHLDNILFCTSTAEILHIDFDICFEKGRQLAVPEVVPFRLTRHLVQAMGYQGTEGCFHSAASTTLDILRKNRSSLMSHLRMFITDPLRHWSTDRRHRSFANMGGTKRKKLLKAQRMLHGAKEWMSDVVESAPIELIESSVDHCAASAAEELLDILQEAVSAAEILLAFDLRAEESWVELTELIASQSAGLSEVNFQGVHAHLQKVVTRLSAIVEENLEAGLGSKSSVFGADSISDLPIAGGGEGEVGGGSDKGTRSEISKSSSGIRSALHRVDSKLRGVEACGELNVAQQVAYLIQEATDESNLARMFEGWMAWI